MVWGWRIRKKISAENHKNRQKSGDGLWGSFVDMCIETTSYVVEAVSAAWAAEGFSGCPGLYHIYRAEQEKGGPSQPQIQVGSPMAA